MDGFFLGIKLSWPLIGPAQLADGHRRLSLDRNTQGRLLIRLSPGVSLLIRALRCEQQNKKETTHDPKRTENNDIYSPPELMGQQITNECDTFV
jgi:hypothetical protein